MTHPPDVCVRIAALIERASSGCSDGASGRRAHALVSRSADVIARIATFIERGAHDSHDCAHSLGSTTKDGVLMHRGDVTACVEPCVDTARADAGCATVAGIENARTIARANAIRTVARADATPTIAARNACAEARP